MVIFSSFELCGPGSVFVIRIRIYEVAEYGSNIDPNPQHWLEACFFFFKCKGIILDIWYCCLFLGMTIDRVTERVVNG